MNTFHKKTISYSILFSLALIIIFTISLSLRSIQSNANTFQTSTSWTSTTTGNWNRPETWGLYGGLQQFSNNFDVEVSKNGSIYLTDGFVPSRIVVLNPDGTASTSYPLNASYAGGLKIAPVSGYMYVLNDVDGNGVNYQTIILNPDGTASTTFPIAGIQAISNAGYLYLASSTSIVVLNPDGSASTTLGDVGSPLYTAIGSSTPGTIGIATSTGLIYYTDTAHDRVVVLNANGTYSTTYPLVPGFAPIVSRIFTLTNGHIDFWYQDDTDFGVGVPVGSNSTVYEHGYGVTDFNANFSASTTKGYSLASFAPQAPAISNVALTPGGDKLYATAVINPSRLLVFDTSNYSLTTTYNGLQLPNSYIPTEGIDFPGPSDTALVNKGTVTLSQDQNAADVTLSSGGTLNLNGHILTINSGGVFSNNGGTLQTNGGIIKYLGLFNASTTGAWNNPLTWGIVSSTTIADIDYPGTHSSASIATGTVTLTETESVHNMTLSAGGTLNLLGNTLNISGNWINTGGIFQLNPGTEGTVNFNSNNSQTIFGSNTFENLTKVASQISSLLFDVNSTTTITHNLNLGDTGGYLSLSATGFTVPQFLSVFAPTGFSVAHDSSGNIYVYGSNQIVRKYDKTGNFLLQWSVGGLGNLYNGIGIDANDNIYVTHEGLGAFGYVPFVAKYDTDGNLLSQFGSEGTGPGQLSDFMFGLTVDQRDGSVYVSNSGGSAGNGTVEKFDANGNYVTRFGTYGTGNGQINGPAGLAVDTFGNVYVADSGNDRIDKFSSSGSFILSFGSTGTGNGQLKEPWDIAFDPSGNMYVTDRNNNRVEIFNPDTSYKGQFGSAGSGNGQFNGPLGVDVDTSGSVYVTNYAGGNTQKFGRLNVSSFALLHQVNSGGTVNLSGLSVTGSNNMSTSTFTCTVCLDGGSNINWNIIAPKSHSQIVAALASSTTATSTATSTDTTATSTDSVATSTASTTPVAPAQQQPVIKGKSKSQNAPTSTSISKISSTLLLGVGTTTATSSQTTASSTVASTGNISSTSSSNIVSNVTNAISNSIAASAPLKSVSDAVNSSVGSALTKTISTTGVVAGASAAISAVAFANPITFAELWLIPTRLFGLFVGALGVRRKNRPWGTVYDSVTKRPIDPAYVSLIDTATGKEVATAITDLDGRYSFSVLPGTYKIIAQKTNYSPSMKMMGKSFDEVYTDLYFGTDITIEHEGEVITKNIPMDPQGFDWNEFTKNKMNINTFIKERDITWAKLSKIIFVVGFIVSVIGLIFSPAPYNLIIAIFYIVAYTLNYFVFKIKRAGSILEKATNTPLSFAIVKIFKEGETTPLLKKIADKFGNYYSLVPKGNYFIEVDKKLDDGSYAEVFKSNVLSVPNGVINLDVKI